MAWDAGAQRLQVRLRESQTAVKVKREKCSVDAGQNVESELDLVRHSKEFKGHTYALAKALWDREELDATNEAIDVSTKVGRCVVATAWEVPGSISRLAPRTSNATRSLQSHPHAPLHIRNVRNGTAAES